MDFFEKQNGTVGWELVSRFDAVRPGFRTDWKERGDRLLWSVCVNDVLEMDCPPEVDGSLQRKAQRQLFKVRKFSGGKMGVTLACDARQLSPSSSDPTYMKQLEIDNKGLSFWVNHRARKVDLSPFGKVMRKHRKLLNGKKKKE